MSELRTVRNQRIYFIFYQKIKTSHQISLFFLTGAERQLVEARWYLNNCEPNRTGEDSLDVGSSQSVVLLLLAFERIFIVLIRCNNSRRGDVWGSFRQISHFCAFSRISKPLERKTLFPTLASRPAVRSQSAPLVVRSVRTSGRLCGRLLRASSVRAAAGEIPALLTLWPPGDVLGRACSTHDCNISAGREKFAYVLSGFALVCALRGQSVFEELRNITRRTISRILQTTSKKCQNAADSAFSAKRLIRGIRTPSHSERIPRAELLTTPSTRNATISPVAE